MTTQTTQTTQNNLGEGVILDPPPAPTTTNNTDSIDESTQKRTRHFCFTTNNYTTTLYNEILDWCRGQKVYVLGKEGNGEGFTPHIQGYVQTKNGMTLSAIHKKIRHSFIETKKGPIFKAITYCMKEGDFITNSEFRPIKPVKDPLEGLTLYPYQQEIKDLIAAGGDDRKINWYWERTGNVGKTSFCKHLCIEDKNIIILSGKGSDMLNGMVQYEENHHKYPTTVILDIPRCVEHISYGGIEKLKDGLFYSGKYKGKMVVMNSPTIIVFSNGPPDREKLSADRWNIKKIEINNDSDDETDDSDID